MDKREINTTGKFAAILSATEIGLGSVLHSWKFPFSGHFLSLNQGFVLSRSVRDLETSTPGTPFNISIITASLKSLSPAGKRLTPMLAISIQGLLYSSALLLFGRNYFGRLMAILFLSLWAFLQPLLLYLLVFGKSIIDVGQYFFDSIQSLLPITWDLLLYAIFALVLVKLCLAAAVNHLAAVSSDEEVETYFSKLRVRLNSSPGPSESGLSAMKRISFVLKDLTRPWFVFSLVLVFAFIFVTKPDLVTAVWYILRPLAIGFIVFYALRFLPLQDWLKRYVFKGNSELSMAMEQTLDHLNPKDSREGLK